MSLHDFMVRCGANEGVNMQLRDISGGASFLDQSDDKSIYVLAVTWLLMVPLLFFAVDGVVRLSADSHNSSYAAAYGTLAADSTVNPVDKVAKLVTYPACAVLIIAMFPTIANVLVRSPLLLGLSILPIASTMWSQFPSQSFMSGIYLALDVGFAVYLMVRFRLREQMQLLMVLGWIVMGASILTAVFIPSYGTAQADVGYAGSWIGLFPHKNWCSVMMAFLLSPVLYMRPAHAMHKVARITFIVLTLFLILMAQSRTGWIVTGSLFAYVALTKSILRFRKQDRPALVMGMGTVLCVAGILFIRYSSEIMFLLGKDPTLTGRTSIWKLTLLSIMKAPILGYGFQAFWHGLQGESANVTLGDSWGVPAAHDGYLEVWLGLGALGLGLVICAILKAYRDGYICYRSHRLKSVEWYLCIIWLTLVSNVAETTLLVPHDMGWIMFVMACVGLNEEARRGRGQGVV
jgi:exopolysaccharide production protein ExoQ